MQNLIPIQITLQAANAADAKQLVLDLASTMTTINPADIPARTEVSTVEQQTQPMYPQTAPHTQPVPTYQLAPPPAQQQPTYQPQTAYPGQGYQPPNSYVLPGTMPGGAPAGPPAQQPPAQQPGMVPTSVQSYTIEQIAVAATPLVDAGRREEVVAILKNYFGVDALTSLPKEHYGAFATHLRALGAQI